MESTTQYAAIISLILLVATYFFSQPTGLVKWLQKKNYQYEVTFSLYMLSPTEKFIFNSILFLTLSMFSIACVLYLPAHMATMARRAYWYCAGDTALRSSSRHAAETLYGTATRAGDAILDATTSWAATAFSAAMNKSVETAAGVSEKAASNIVA